MKKCKISPATLARTTALALALTNQVLSATGHRVLPIESAELEQLGHRPDHCHRAGQLVEEQFLHPGGHRSR
jgi:hypothetical protein